MNRSHLSALVVTTLVGASFVPAPANSKPAPVKTKLSLSASPPTVNEGVLTALSGRLTSKKKACKAGQTVKLRAFDGGSVVQVAKMKTDDKGLFSFDQTPSASTTFDVRYDGKKGCRGSTSAKVRVTVFTLPPPDFQGPPDEEALDHIPDAPFPNARLGDVEYSDAVGTFLDVWEFLLALKPGVTVAQANALLDSVGADIIGGNPDAGWILARFREPHTDLEYLDVIDQLDIDPSVDLVAPESLIEVTRAPGPDPAPQAFDGGGNAASADWLWFPPQDGGNWALEASRGPQAWNLLDELARSQRFSSTVGVLDSGFDPAHPDLGAVGSSPAKLVIETLGGTNPNPGPPPLAGFSDARDHGTGVAGIISARFHNYRDLDGVAPSVEGLGGTVGLAMRTGPPSADEFGQPPVRYLLTRVINDFGTFIRTRPEIKVFNISLGYPQDVCNPEDMISWRAQGVAGDAVSQNRARRMVRQHGRLVERIFPDVNHAERGVLLFAAAGNTSDLDGTDYPVTTVDGAGNVIQPCLQDSNLDGVPDNPPIDLNGDGTPDDPPPVDISAEWGSPFCYASVTLLVPGILCVEAARDVPGFPRANFSNGNGAFAAGGDGVAVLSASQSPVEVGVSGTSQASPLAAGIAAWVDAFANRGAFRSRPEQALTRPALIDLLRDSARPVASNPAPSIGVRAPFIDMFSALTHLDQLNSNRFVQQALVDVDDGSQLDGNARLDWEDENKNGLTREAYPFGIKVSDDLRGDGRIDMKDFRAFRDAMLQTAAGGLTPLADVFLDGARAHFKKDINLDGCVGDLPAAPPHPDPPIGRAPNCSDPLFTPFSASDAERSYSRYDFNGDGLLNGMSTTPGAGQLEPFGIVLPPGTNCTGIGQPAGCVRDIDLLTDNRIWATDAENVAVPGLPGVGTGDCTDTDQGWRPTTDLLQDQAGPTASTLDGTLDYLLSADLHFDIGKDPTGDMDHVFIDVDSELPGNGTDDDGDGKLDEPFERSFNRCLDIGPKAGKTIVTVPLFTRHVLVTVLGIDTDLDKGRFSADPYGYRFPETGLGDAVEYGRDLYYKVKPQK